VSILLRQCDLRGSILGGDSGELHHSRLRFPVVFVSIEYSSVVVKFVRKDQL